MWSSWKLPAPVAVALVLSALACSTHGDAPPAEPEHVHGLGVNPADGVLYVAKHDGVFRLVHGELTRQGFLRQDTMGFTVAGPDRFLASGHPDENDDSVLAPGMPRRLGLVESTDRALSWRGLSLQGEVDFHTLAFAHGRVYAYDATAGVLMVSKDTIDWESRARVQLSSFAVSPLDPERLIGVRAAQNVTTSADGGRTWHPVEPAVSLAFVSWGAERGLWGIADGGAVFRSSDEGMTWLPAGTAARSPTAFLAHADGLFVATSDAVHRSSDDGATWSALGRTH